MDDVAGEEKEKEKAEEEEAAIVSLVVLFVCFGISFSWKSPKVKNKRDTDVQRNNWSNDQNRSRDNRANFDANDGMHPVGVVFLSSFRFPGVALTIRKTTD